MDAHITKRQRGLTLTHVYILGVIVLAGLTAVLIAQRAEILRMGRELVHLEARHYELREECRKLNSQVEGLRSLASLQQALQRLDIDLVPPAFEAAARSDAHAQGDTAE